MYAADRWSFAAALALMARGSAAGQSTAIEKSYLVRFLMDDT
jgi:hypothetical protein